jgi:surfactin synthase thioesterase subunit
MAAINFGFSMGGHCSFHFAEQPDSKVSWRTLLFVLRFSYSYFPPRKQPLGAGAVVQ